MRAGGARVALALCVCLAAPLAAQAPVAARPGDTAGDTPDDDAGDTAPFDAALVEGASVGAGPHTATVPLDGRDAWRAARAEAGLGERPLVEASPASAARALAALGPHIAWERAALSHSATTGSPREAWVARQWLDALADIDPGADAPADGGAGTALPQRLTWAALFIDGSAAALLPPACMPADPSVLFAVAAAESAPSRRNASSVEVLSALPADGVLREALQAPGAAPLAASLLFVRAAHPTLAIPARGDDPEGCDATWAEAAAAWGATGPADWVRVQDALQALASDRPLPANVLRRAALHWYLQVWSTPIHALLTHADDADPSTLAAMRALAAGVDQDFDAMSEAAEGVERDGPFSNWVRAESLRLGGDPRGAVERVDRAIHADPLFFAAYLTRASANIARGATSLARPDLAFLQRAYASVPAYAVWIDRLAARLR